MAANSNNNTNSFSSAGNNPFDLSWLFQYNDSNASLNNPSSSSRSGLNLGHGQLGRVTSVTTEVRRTYVSPQSGHQSASFPVPDGTVTYEVVRSTRFFVPPSTMDHTFVSSSGVGNQGSTLPTNVGVFNQEQQAGAGQPAEQSQPVVRNQFNMLASTSNLNRNQVNLSSSAGVRILEQGQQPIMRNQPHRALNIFNNVNQRSNIAHEVIDVDAYDNEVCGNSSRASENQSHRPNIQVKNDAFSENPSMNLANHGSDDINVPINGGIHENSANASDPLLDNAGHGRGR
ncbi:hypothetical protein CCACVL1_19651 [Corchorus capsularis]|uniref:Uncharacterized protein n=1 Tax=Corchorus capsularis TaxID=210143 RepID=A0A1R3HFP7_COCAP|nr:hypothetical protein CCACVL1_19651 [Corchorus capsularis]